MEKKTNNEEEVETAEQKYRYAQQDEVDARYELKAAYNSPNPDTLKKAMEKYLEAKAKTAAATYLAERA